MRGDRSFPRWGGNQSPHPAHAPRPLNLTSNSNSWIRQTARHMAFKQKKNGASVKLWVGLGFLSSTIVMILFFSILLFTAPCQANLLTYLQNDVIADDESRLFTFIRVRELIKCKLFDFYHNLYFVRFWFVYLRSQTIIAWIVLFLWFRLIIQRDLDLGLDR